MNPCQRRGKGTLVVALVLATAALNVVAPTPATALCMSPMEASSAAREAAAVSQRYVWFLIESLAHGRVAWQEADSADDSQNPAVKLADFKLAIDDLQCAASLVRPFQSVHGPDDHTTEAVQTSATAATAAYTMFAAGFQQWVTALAHGEGGLPLEVAADVKVRNEKAGEFLIHAAGAAWFALLKPQTDSKAPMDRLLLTRAQRTALLNGLKSRRFSPEPDLHAAGTHTPDLAAAVLCKGLSNPKYKAFDEP